MRYLFPPCEFKAAGDNGNFSGYAAIFGNVDLGGDVVERGAFKEIVKNDAGQVVVLWQHSQRSPIGVASVKQDDKGLAFEGHLVMEDPQARIAHAHMKAGSVRGMSIGFDVREGGAKIMESGIRQLTDIKLWEVSVVTFPMNQLAGVDAVKAGQIQSIRDFEEFLRDAGFPKGMAIRLAASGWKTSQDRSDSGGSGDLTPTIERISALAVPNFSPE